jgi:undecaprenyl-diphosphatase
VNYWQGIVLGLVQGLTEFLPVSSSGHLVLAEALTGVKPPGVFVEVALHVATLGSVLIVYGRRLWELVVGLFQRSPDRLRYIGLLIVGSIPAAVIGLLFQKAIEERFHSLPWLGIEFIVTGIILWSTRRQGGERTAPGWGGAFGVGLGQAFAILPAISRSGATVAAALWMGLTPAAAAEFSFLLAVPVIAGAAVLEGRHAVGNVAAVGLGPLVVSFILSFVSGVFAIRFLVALLRRGRFYAFAPYCWVVGVLTLVYALWQG